MKKHVINAILVVDFSYTTYTFIFNSIALSIAIELKFESFPSIKWQGVIKILVL